MTSTERKAKRRRNREVIREEKRNNAIGKYDDFERVISANSLIAAAKESRKGVRWKASVQKYMMSLLRNTWDLRKKLKRGISIVQGFISFTISERGKTRNIRSVHFKERCVQRSVCDNALVPVLGRSLVYDNGASLKGKGIHFAIHRCEKHLRTYYRQHRFTNHGWVLMIDFSGYFDNIQHTPILKMLNKAFRDKRIVKLVWSFVKSFGEKSLGIGSQVSQILAVSYPSAIDHYVREVLGINLSGRYMDDSYYMHESREYLEYCLERLKVKFNELGIKINLKKTHIIPIRKFTFLKVRFYLTESGKVVKKPCKRNTVHMRSKLKSFVHLVENGDMTFEDVKCAYQSWRGYLKHVDGHRTSIEMDKLFFSLFGFWPLTKKEIRR